MSSVSYKIIDNNMESSTVSFPMAIITSANADLQLVEAATVGAGIDAMTRGARDGFTVIMHQERTNPSRPVDPDANREAGVVFGMTSVVTGGKVRFTLPAPNLSKFPFAALGVGRVEAPFSNLHADLTNLIDAVESAARFVPTGDGEIEEVTVTYLEHVGRNL